MLTVDSVLLMRAVLLGIQTVDLDEASFLVGSWELLRGRVLYSDLADHKPPFVCRGHLALPMEMADTSLNK
jgi:hypothetical protein